MMKYRPKDFDKETFGFSDRKKGEILGKGAFGLVKKCKSEIN